jgi:hypothetical protein
VVTTAWVSPACSGGSDQPLHARAQLDCPVRHQGGVVLLLAAHQGIQQGGIGGLGALIAEKDAQPLATATDRQQLDVGGRIPVPGEAFLGKRPVEGRAMAVQLGFRQRAVHVPEQGAKGMLQGSVIHARRLSKAA